MRAAGALALTLALASVSLAGCGERRGTAGEGRPDADNPTQKIAERTTIPDDGGADSPDHAVVRFERIAGRTYADAGKLAGLIGFHTEFAEDGKSLLIGDHDPVLTIADQSREVVKAGRVLAMVHPAVLASGRMLVPSNELKKLFGDEAAFTVDAAQAVVFPVPPADDPAADRDFADDPAVPAGDRHKDAPWTAQSADDNSGASAAELIREAKRYLGVKYQFGAAHYTVSKRFDCSSFVQFLYAGQGIELPRTARAQAKLGVEVPRDRLRPGDLLFFHVPGRFKSDNVVGHVGIYIGDRQMIHSSPLPQDGVQITDIDKPYWKETFLLAKRVL
jgi:cell wall-associated NlpC family hydrolase